MSLSLEERQKGRKKIYFLYNTILMLDVFILYKHSGIVSVNNLFIMANVDIANVSVNALCNEKSMKLFWYPFLLVFTTIALCVRFRDLL